MFFQPLQVDNRVIVDSYDAEAFQLKGHESSAEKKMSFYLSGSRLTRWSTSSKIVLCRNFFLNKSMKALLTFATPWPKHWLQNKTEAAEYNCGRGPSQLIHKGFKWEFFVVRHMSCVGYQSRLFPVCVNSLPHRLCLGYTPPQGVAF